VLLCLSLDEAISANPNKQDSLTAEVDRANEMAVFAMNVL